MAGPESRICMGCMKKVSGDEPCPHCGATAGQTQPAPFLPLKTIVGGRYLIGLVKEHNGDGATYIGWDMIQKSAVMVREFFPDAIAERAEDGKSVRIIAGCESTFDDCYQSFLDLWRKLVRMRGLSALIVAYDIVEENGTAYAVYEHFDACTLRDYLLRNRNGNLTWEQARPMFMPVLSTLGNLHASGIIHRGISPQTLLVGTDGKIRISGFSIWQSRTARGDLTAQLYPGYAAIEQYGFKGQQGPWTDIYAFAAVLYRTLVGTTPLEATARATNDKLIIPPDITERTPAYVLSAMKNALEILPEDRTHSVDQLRAELSASPGAVMATNAAYSTQQLRRENAVERSSAESPAKKVPSNKKTVAMASGITLAVLVVIGVVLAFTVFRDQWAGLDEQETTTQNSASQTIDIPKFVGRLYSTISSNAYFTSIFDFEVTYVYDGTYTEGTIIEQDIQPQSGYQTNGEKTTIRLKVSQGVEKKEIPKEIEGMKLEDAQKLLQELGFTNIKVEEVPGNSSDIPNTVWKVTPVPGSGPVDPSETVILQVIEGGSTEPATTAEPATAIRDWLFNF